MMRPVTLGLAIILALSFACAGDSDAQAPPEEGTRVATMPAPTPHWIFLYNLASLGSFTPSSVTILDGDTRKVLGMLTGGLGSSFAIAPDRSAFYMADTFFSRGSRGERTDVVTIYDGKTLNPSGEVILPGRQLTAQDNATIGVTPDGKLLLAANMTPATSATVVDIANKKMLGQIEMTGCVEILMTGNRQFDSLCGDGSMMTTDFNENAKATSQKRTTAPFFNPDKDPVYALPAIIGKQAYFLSYGGKIYPVDLSSDPATPGEPWPLLTADEKKKNWKPGGVQALAVHQNNGQIYVLMHQGGEWTHKMPGVDVWVYDVKTHARIKEIKLKQMADAIMATQDSNPILAAAMPFNSRSRGGVEFYSATNGRLLGGLNDLAVSPFEHIYGF
ncbi:MAG TPA: amine dehydrogenase large subunit [Candidatus Binataceae bacterium]